MSPQSFEQIYKEWSSYVYSLAYRLTGNKADAEDLTQDSFIRVFRFLKNFRGGSVKGWLYKIVTNTFYMKLDKDKKSKVFPDQDELESRLAFLSIHSSGKTLDQRKTEPNIHKALASLPTDYRVAVVLADLEELNYKEISEALDIPIGTVRSRISRGRHLLKETLIEERRKT